MARRGDRGDSAVLRRLRIKFVALVMGAVFLVMTGLFSAIVAIDWQQGSAEEREVLAQAVASSAVWDEESGEDGEWDHPGRGRRGHRPDIGWRGDERPSSPTAPVAVYAVEEGTLEESPATGAVLNADGLAEAAAAVVAAPDGYGSVGALGLRYLKETTETGTYVGFVEASLFDGWKRLGAVLLLVEAAVLLVLLAASWAFSGWALRPVRRAWEQQRRFVADASHDLKTPLAVILANTSILLEEPELPPDERGRWLESTREEVAAMRRLVDELLLTACDGVPADEAESDGAWGQAADAPLVDLSRAVEHDGLQFEAVAYGRRASLAVTVAEGLFVRADPQDVHRLLSVLLDNAGKYVDEGGSIGLDLSVEDGGATARLAVSNTGEPIDPAALPHLFERFYRSDEARSSKQGHGLGLAVARALVTRMGGTIDVESDVAATVFTVLLPTA